MRGEHERVRSAGGRVAAVLMGRPDAVGAYCAERDVPFDCLADADRSAYRAFGLSRSGEQGRLVSGRTLLRGARLFTKGIVPWVPDRGQDVRQMPGTFVAGPDGTIRLAHYSRDPSDLPSVDALLAAIEG